MRTPSAAKWQPPWCVPSAWGVCNLSLAAASIPESDLTLLWCHAAGKPQKGYRSSYRNSWAKVSRVLALLTASWHGLPSSQHNPYLSYRTTPADVPPPRSKPGSNSSSRPVAAVSVGKPAAATARIQPSVRQGALSCNQVPTMHMPIAAAPGDAGFTHAVQSLCSQGLIR
jgi:hypothetical protein